MTTIYSPTTPGLLGGVQLSLEMAAYKLECEEAVASRRRAQEQEALVRQTKRASMLDTQNSQQKKVKVQRNMAEVQRLDLLYSDWDLADATTNADIDMLLMMVVDRRFR
jgi:hypothetical protein